MHYMLIIIADETKPVPTSAERAALMQAYGDFTRQIMDSGHFRSGAALQPSSTASTVREQRRALVVTEGPFAGGRDHVAGFYIVECAHLDEAVAIAGRVPGVRLGETVEIRPLVPTSVPIH